MYTEHYSLTEMPFNVTPDPKFLYMSDQHRTALNHLLFCVRQGQGFALLTGEVGTGKTTLCRKLLESLEMTHNTALILNPMLSGPQLLRAVVEEFGLESRGGGRLESISLLNQFLLGASASGREAALIIDEAQDMSAEMLEMTRLLSNLETNSRKLLQIVLVGQPELRRKLRSPGLRQLDQRIIVRCHLRPMSLEETTRYIRYRLYVAGAKSTLRFADDAAEEVFRHSGGTPRLINALCDKSLLAGYVRGTSYIDSELVRLAVRELKEAA
ncbi:MAG: ATPase [Phycisphaerae bacterium SM23_33]|jgi:general secretion pathway protein A|nr:MAG: ATPase [Phycisphaerae bacterium SM23_33]